MPRNVRNFWATVQVDGRDSELASGPVARDGGLCIRLAQRDNGGINTDVVRVECYARQDGTLITVVHIEGMDRVEYITRRGK